MGRSSYIMPGALGEYNFQAVQTHDGTVAGAIQRSVIRVGDGKSRLIVKGDVFRKLDFTGVEVTTVIQMFELTVPSTGGGQQSNPFAVDKDRERGGLPKFTTFVVDDGTLVVDETDMKIMLNEFGSAVKGGADRSKDLDLDYELKPNTHYMIKSTIIDGPTANSQDVVLGTYIELKEG